MNLKKPKFWDYKKPNYLAYLLFPISLIITSLNNFFYKPRKNQFKIKTICIGNFYVGGTGKTSLSIKINKILNKKNIKTCFIKKSYKNQIDEQKILENSGKLFLSNDRVDAIKQAESENYEIAILDDGLQDRKIQYDISFVCFNNLNWIGNGMTIPAGPLRENINNLKNYNHIFLNGNLENIQILKEEIFKINPNINVHIGKYNPTNLYEFKKDKKYLVFSGIGNHNTFVSMIKKVGLNVIKEIEFPDHYMYTDKDLNFILKEADKLTCELITTEKDFLRIDNPNLYKIKIMKSELTMLDENKLINFLI